MPTPSGDLDPRPPIRRAQSRTRSGGSDSPSDRPGLQQRLHSLKGNFERRNEGGFGRVAQILVSLCDLGQRRSETFGGDGTGTGLIRGGVDQPAGALLECVDVLGVGRGRQDVFRVESIGERRCSFLDQRQLFRLPIRDEA